MPAPKVLIVDDQPQFTEAMHRYLEPHGCEVRELHEATQALEVAREFGPDFVLLDYYMPLLKGDVVAWQLVNALELEGINVVLCSGLPEALLDLDLPPGVRITTKPISYGKLVEWLDLEPLASVA